MHTQIKQSSAETASDTRETIHNFKFYTRFSAGWCGGKTSEKCAFLMNLLCFLKNNSVIKNFSSSFSDVNDH